MRRLHAWLLTVTALAGLSAASAATAPSQTPPKLSSKERAQATQMMRELTARPQALLLNPGVLYGDLGADRGEVLVVTYQMPQDLADALVKAARAGARVTVLTDARTARSMVALKSVGIALYRSSIPVNQGILVYGSVVLTGRLVNKTEQGSSAFRSVTTADSIRATWPTLVKLSTRL
ncbi:hypothetical protein [Deinococcus budaensis]|uniref:FlgO domain-containing protein n=1 Tax=Deinococcus budaensis TaxID=1665626 RepID=A0A7W8GEK2_9DEIO|nr:hypothetical protein [Deinococcus budaensis]MBB5234192.1 hypothetical protein [Deinococcus budaensis]